MLPVETSLPLRIRPQPDEKTCGPTGLNAIYRYWWLDEPLTALIERTHKLEHGSTLAVFLPGVDMADRLRRQREAMGVFLRRIEERKRGGIH